jgi:phosphatidylglycerol:prolipoprotein diacylglycerol transferase
MRPILFHIGSYGVHSYGVLLMLAIVFSVWRAYSHARSRKAAAPAYPIAPDDVLDVTLWIVAGIVIGARVLFVAVDWGEYKGHLADIFKVWNGGLSFHGGFIGVILALILFARSRRIPFLTLGDLIAPSAMLGYAIGRVGCFFNGCCYGSPTSMPWGVRFHDDGILTPPSHPTQLYSTALSLVFFGILLGVEKRQKFAGQIAFLYVLFSAIERFIMEIWRADVTSTVIALGMTDVQWLCITMAVVAVSVLVWLRRRGAGMSRQAPPLSAARL